MTYQKKRPIYPLPQNIYTYFIPDFRRFRVKRGTIGFRILRRFQIWICHVMPVWYIALFGCFGALWELFTKKGSCRACFKNYEYAKIISIAPFVHEKNAKNSTKRKSFENDTCQIWNFLIRNRSHSVLLMVFNLFVIYNSTQFSHHC
jgi:hypothetical protein